MKNKCLIIIILIMVYLYIKNNKIEERYASDIIEQELLNNRIVFISGVVDEELADKVIKELIYLDTLNNKEINIFLNSEGGNVYDGLSIFDTIKRLRSPVNIVVTGFAGSMGLIIFMAAEKERRFLYPESTILIHQPSQSYYEQRVDKTQMNIDYAEMERIDSLLVSIIAESTGRSKEEIRKDMMRDKYFSAKDSVEYGFASKII